MRLYTFKACIGPVVISALSFFISFLVLQPIAIYLDPSFHLLANRGVGKIAFTTMAIVQILLLLYTQPPAFRKWWIQNNVLFLKNKQWLSPFFIFFGLFFLLHSGIILFALQQGEILYNNNWATAIKPSVLMSIGFGFIVTFFLAWSEELIFRGTLYAYFTQYLTPLSSILVTSFVFMAVHNLTNPLHLITHEWQLGLGLFLLGMLLNLVFFKTGNLYTGMGIHAGLVFVKIILRRIPLLSYTHQTQWAWWFAQDLRQAPLVHLLFIIIILLLIIRYRKKLALPPHHT